LAPAPTHGIIIPDDDLNGIFRKIEMFLESRPNAGKFQSRGSVYSMLIVFASAYTQYNVERCGVGYAITSPGLTRFFDSSPLFQAWLRAAAYFHVYTGAMIHAKAMSEFLNKTDQ